MNNSKKDDLLRITQEEKIRLEVFEEEDEEELEEDEDAGLAEENEGGPPLPDEESQFKSKRMR